MRKNSKHKKLSCSILTVILTISLVGCGSTSKSSSSDGSKESNGGNKGNNSANQAESSGGYMEGALFQYGMVSAKTEDSKWGFMNMKGEWAIKPVYRSVIEFGPDGMAFVSKESKEWRLIDTKGEYLSDTVYTYVNPFSACGIAEVSIIKDKKETHYYIYKDANGNVVEYDASKWITTGNFSSDGYAVVSVWDDAANTDYEGIIDSNFNYVMEPKSGMDYNFISNGLMCVIDYNNQISGMMNMNGEWVYQTPSYLENYEARLYNNGKIKDRYGKIMDSNGTLLANVNELTKDMPMGPYDCENSKSYSYGEWMLIVSGSKNSSYNVNYLDENYKPVFSNPIHLYSNDSYGNEYGDLRYDRLIIKVPVDKDASGKVTGIAVSYDENTVEKEIIVIDSNMNIIFVPSELGYSSVHEYFADGYTYTHKSKNEYLVIDKSGNALFTTSEAVDFIDRKE